jgi:hypothetical protein
MASDAGEDADMDVTGFSRSEAIVAPAKGSLARRVGEGGIPGSVLEVGGSKSFAASQSSSTNYYC